MLVLVIVLGVLCFWNSHLFSTAPFASEYVFDGPSGVFRGNSGNTYVVDVARKEILILNEDLEYVRTIEGGSAAEDSFYYATAVTDGPDGIYVADAVYSGAGTVICAERIMRFESDGSGGEELFRLDYPDAETSPRQYGRIKSLCLQGNTLVFATVQEHLSTVYTLDLADGSVDSTEYDFGGSYAVFACPDPTTLRPVIIAGDTTLQTMDEGGTVRELTRTNGFPYQLAVTNDGTVWFSELDTGGLMCIGENGEMEMVSDEVYTYYISANGNTLCISDGAGIAIYQDGQGNYLTEVSIANSALRSAMWCLLALGAVMLLILLVSAANAVVHSWMRYPFFRRVAMVIAVAVVASSVVSWYLLSTTFQAENEQIMEQLDAISDEIVAATDADLVSRIHGYTDYKNVAYNEQKAKLDQVINDGYARGEYFYYLTYVTDKEIIYGLMDYEDTVRTYMTYEAYGVEGYTDVFETGEPLLIEGEVSTWGAWTLILKPVYDENGSIVAVQEVGFNYDNQLISQRETIINTVLTIVFGAIVLVMMLIEGIYFLEHRRKKQELLSTSGSQFDATDTFPLRMLVFMAFTVDCMQDAFISILATKLYEPVFGIPQSVGAALPISAQVLMAAVFAVLGGFFANRFGAKRVICTGFILEASGFLLCAAFLNYYGILLGKMLVGSGVGMVTVGVNTIAASSVDSDKSVETFAGITAGTLAGVSAGSGLGSVILSLAGYRLVFLSGAAILSIGFMLAASGRENRETNTTTVADNGSQQMPKHSIGMGRFLVGKGGSLPFLAMVLLPFMIAIYFREYFFPVFSAENGITETNIGRIYVLCGLMVIYAGPVLTKYLTENLGEIRTVVLTSATISLASLIFGLIPNMVGAFIGMLLVSLAVSSGYTAQSSYYASLKVVDEFGEGRSMGVYSMFDNSGQTLGPIVYGSAMMLGYQTGMFAVGCGLAALTAAFAAIKHKDIKSERKRMREEHEAC